MLTVHRDVGRRFVADDGFELPPLTELMAGTDRRQAAEIAPAVASEPVRQRLAATYFDTADRRLTTAGLALRRRSGGDSAGWQLDVPTGSDACAEVRLPAGRARRTVPTQLQQMVWARSLGAALQPVAEIVTDRTVTRLVDVTGHVVAKLADDRITARRVLPTDGPASAVSAATSWREIEVHLADGDADLLAVVAARLRERGLNAPSAPGLASVLDLQPDGASATTDGPELTDRSSSGDVLLAHIREQVERVQAYDLPVRLDAPDAVHKMRVATRRLRSALTTFKALFAPDVVRPLRGELKWLAGELGAARDAEVMRDRVASAVETEGEAVDMSSVAAVSDEELGQAYRGAHDRVLSELDGERYHALLVALDGLATAPPLKKRAARPARKALPGLVARSFTDVRRIVQEADVTPEGDEREELLHDARKAAKRSRYAAESVSGIFGADAVAFAEAMEEVQEALGEHQDSVLTRERLRDLALHTSSTDAAFLYGRLHALEEVRGRESQDRFDAAWKAAGRKSLHRWLR
jgi:CHAD domain-containing protein